MQSEKLELPYKWGIDNSEWKIAPTSRQPTTKDKIHATSLDEAWEIAADGQLANAQLSYSG